LPHDRVGFRDRVRNLGLRPIRTAALSRTSRTRPLAQESASNQLVRIPVTSCQSPRSRRARGWCRATWHLASAMSGGTTGRGPTHSRPEARARSSAPDRRGRARGS
jgi:hypothetical protein